MQYLVSSFLLLQGVLVYVIICYGRANSVMFIGSSDGCGCRYLVCGDRAGVEMMVAGTRRVQVSYLREWEGMGVMDCSRAALYHGHLTATE